MHILIFLKKNNVKKLLSLLVFSLFCINNYAQVDIFDDLQGIKYYNQLDFDLSGNQISIFSKKMKFNEKSIKKIIKQIGIKNITKEYQDNAINIPNTVIEGYQYFPDKEATVNYLCYMFQNTDNSISIVLFASQLPINPFIVKQFIDAYLKDQLSNYFFNYQSNEIVDSINFAGRTIPLKNECWYINVNNVQCSQNEGEMSWSTFDLQKEAEDFKNIMINVGKHIKNYRLATDTTVNVLFENVETPARRMIYKMRATQDFVFDKHLICLYYITQKNKK